MNERKWRNCEALSRIAPPPSRGRRVGRRIRVRLEEAYGQKFVDKSLGASGAITECRQRNAHSIETDNVPFAFAAIEVLHRTAEHYEVLVATFAGNDREWRRI